MSINSSSQNSVANQPTTSSINLVDLGWALVPIPYGCKGPQTKNWNIQKCCVTSPSQVSKLEGMNIGLAHAYCTPTPTCAIDIDFYPDAKPWLAMHGIDIDALLVDGDAVVISSGKKYSIKLLFKLPPNTAPLESKKIVGLSGKTALEFRCASKDGRTVQDVLPPSLHPDGRHYEWVGNGNPLLLPEIPQALLQVWQQLICNGSRVALRRFPLNYGQYVRPDTPRQLATINSALNHISADCDYDKWRNVVWAILSTGWLSAGDIAYAWSKTSPKRFEEDAFWMVANSFIPGHPNQITVGTIYFHARAGGWNG